MLYLCDLHVIVLMKKLLIQIKYRMLSELGRGQSVNHRRLLPWNTNGVHCYELQSSKRLNPANIVQDKEFSFS